MKKFKDLTAADFPGIDPVKFAQWQDAANRLNRNWRNAIIVLVILNVILLIVCQALALGGLLLFVVMAFVNRSAARTVMTLEKELGLTRALVQAARRGELGTKVVSPWAPPPIASLPPLLVPSPEPPPLSAVEPPLLSSEPPPLS